MTRKFLLGEAEAPSIGSYIQSISEVLHSVTPRSRTDERRIEMAKSSLREVRRRAKRLQERVNVLEEQVKILEESENVLEEQAKVLREDGAKYRIARSDINGVGIFATTRISENEDVGIIIDNLNMARWAQRINHQSDPNTKAVKRGENYALVATETIDNGAEITTNYKDMPDGKFNFSADRSATSIDKNTQGFVEK